MRTIGLIGGMSWESSVLYYQWINRGIRDRCGPLHSARLLLDSVDFSEVVAWQREGNWALYGEEIKRLGDLLEQMKARRSEGRPPR